MRFEMKSLKLCFNKIEDQAMEELFLDKSYWVVTKIIDNVIMPVYISVDFRIELSVWVKMI